MKTIDICQAKFLVGIATRGRNPNLLMLTALINEMIEGGRFRNGRIVVAVNDFALGIELPSFPNLEIFYHPIPGYSEVRNALLSRRRPDEGVLFIDDDEIPEPDWISAHLAVANDFPGSIFVGPVTSVDLETRFEVSDSRKPRKISHGSVVNFASTGNLYIPREVFDSADVYFDQYFNAGGEDTDCAFRLKRLGFQTRWNSQAKVSELTPAYRRTSDWRRNREAKAMAIHAVSGHRNFGLSWGIGHGLILVGSLCFHAVRHFFRFRDAKPRLDLAGHALLALWGGRVIDPINRH